MSCEREVLRAPCRGKQLKKQAVELRAKRVRRASALVQRKEERVEASVHQ